MARHLPDGETPFSLKELMKQYRGETERPTLTPSSWLRASSIAFLCPRREVILAREGMPRKHTFGADPHSRLIALHGNALHWSVQNQLLPEHLLGRWRCTACGWTGGGLTRAELARVRELAKVWPSDPIAEEFAALMKKQADNSVPRPGKKCPLCLTKDKEGDLFLYQEQWFGRLDLRLGGHPDGFLTVPWRDGPGVLEVKSISSGRAYKVRATPQMDHVAQIQTYFGLTGFKWGIILYWEKGKNGLQALHEHELEFDPELQDTIAEQIAVLRAGLENPVILPERLCVNEGCEMAGDCAVSKLCFEALP